MSRFILMLLLATPALAIDQDRLLACISAVETGNRPHAVGRAGERGAHQLMASNRRRYGTPRRLLEHIEQSLQEHGIPVTPHTCALAWNGGLTAVIRGTLRPSTWNYACRVENLYNSHESATKAAP